MLSLRAMFFFGSSMRRGFTFFRSFLFCATLATAASAQPAPDPGAAEKILSLTTSIVEENGLTCLMVTHNMQSALELGSRTIMMDAGRVVMDVSGAEREVLEVADLLLRFKEISGKALNNDRMLLI